MFNFQYFYFDLSLDLGLFRFCLQELDLNLGCNLGFVLNILIWIWICYWILFSIFGFEFGFALGFCLPDFVLGLNFC